jgi:sigma-B regulation protein RsbU (phosphoserine phosphatase)
VTVFYGILDQESGLLTYANAGHNPGYLLRRNGNGQKMEQTSALIRTGIPLGMFPDMVWEQKQEVINPGDLLFLYSDGVTEAQNKAGELFEDERLLAVGRARNGRSASEIQTAVLESIHAFVGEADQFDDITLLVVTRD